MWGGGGDRSGGVGIKQTVRQGRCMEPKQCNEVLPITATAATVTRSVRRTDMCTSVTASDTATVAHVASP
jgi:hypothetical protein